MAIPAGTSMTYDQVQRVIRKFDRDHPFRVCRIQRFGSDLICHNHQVKVFAPSLPKPPLTPMEASLSRFD